MCGGDHTRLIIEGPSAWSEPRTALALSMIVHELCMNAVKYGALSKEDGRVLVRWIIISLSNSETIALEWLETGGPTVIAPGKLGFGTRLITQGFGQEVRGRTRFRSNGTDLPDAVCRTPNKAQRHRTPPSIAPNA
jgi:two-component sensor histidine kinase